MRDQDAQDVLQRRAGSRGDDAILRGNAGSGRLRAWSNSLRPRGAASADRTPAAARQPCGSSESQMIWYFAATS